MKTVEDIMRLRNDLLELAFDRIEDVPDSDSLIAQVNASLACMETLAVLVAVLPQGYTRARVLKGIFEMLPAKVEARAAQFEAGAPPRKLDS